jgi:predicted O-methyltransferase YrrM
MIKPSLVLEVGTFTGFSTICLSRGLNEGGRLITLEKNDELEEIILRNLEAADVADKVDLRIGNALELLRTMPEKDFDLIYLDADKEHYTEYYRLLLPMLRKGGWLIADNTLWSGKVADPIATDKVTMQMRKFNNMLVADKQIECIMLPIRDGLTIVGKL